MSFSRSKFSAAVVRWLLLACLRRRPFFWQTFHDTPRRQFALRTCVLTRESWTASKSLCTHYYLPRYLCRRFAVPSSQSRLGRRFTLFTTRQLGSAPRRSLNFVRLQPTTLRCERSFGYAKRLFQQTLISAAPSLQRSFARSAGRSLGVKGEAAVSRNRPPK